uniref:Uncharacterized protein n=1 Tax=Panagrolaimus sp. PS1159 TaxID=55785 RepID=A0AC35FPD2_9BILA
MAGFKMLSILCAFLLFQSTFAFFGKDTTKVKIGCHNFMGTVKCKDGSKILPSAKVELYENDIFGDDLLVEHKLERSLPFKDSATFSWRGCYNDGNILFLGPKFANMELYYMFKDVCYKDDSYAAKDVLQDKNTYILHDEEAYLV